MNLKYYFYSYIYGYFTHFNFICVDLSWEVWILEVIKIRRS